MIKYDYCKAVIITLLRHLFYHGYRFLLYILAFDFRRHMSIGAFFKKKTAHNGLLFKYVWRFNYFWKTNSVLPAEIVSVLPLSSASAVLPPKVIEMVLPLTL